MGNPVTLAIGLGYFAGVAGGYGCARAIVVALCGLPSPLDPDRNRARLLGTAGGLAAIPPAVYLGTVAGGNLGAAYGEAISQALGLGTGGVLFGLAFGIAAVTAAVISIGALVGSLIGKTLLARKSA